MIKGEGDWLKYYAQAKINQGLMKNNRKKEILEIF